LAVADDVLNVVCEIGSDSVNRRICADDDEGAGDGEGECEVGVEAEAVAMFNGVGLSTLSQHPLSSEKGSG